MIKAIRPYLDKELIERIVSLIEQGCALALRQFNKRQVC